jgi:protein-S-isoprenylcysteine O-methyltransferase Ste14
VQELAGRVIAASWCIFFVVWFVAAWFAKRAAQRSDSWVRALVVAALVVVVATRGRYLSLPDNVSLWRVTPAVAITGAAVNLAGLVIALWARFILGRNWSGAVVLKEQHELIDRGPYAFVRHPIYTGLLFMLLGNVLFLGTRAAVVLFAVMIGGLLVKASREERLLTTHFPDAYPGYRTRVRARIIPFVW